MVTTRSPPIWPISDTNRTLFSPIADRNFVLSMSIFGTTSGTIDGRGQSRLAACLSGAFVLFVLAGAVCISKNKNHSKIHRWQVPCSFAGAEMQPDTERPAEHTFRMVKRIDAVWADFCPAKPCLPLFVDGKYTIIQKLPCVKSKSSSSRPKKPPEKTLARWIILRL